MRKIDTTPFDRKKVPPKQNLFFMPFIWAGSWLITRGGHLKIKKERMKGLKPPYLVLGTHHAFMDFCVTPLALFPYRANYISELEGFENYGEWFYRQLGCLGTRKFVNDLALVSNIRRVIKRKGILVLYPEARYANVGTSSEIPSSVGKLAKLLKVPVVVINMHGNYLQSPIWNLKKRKEARLQATITQVLTKEELEESSLEEVNKKLAQMLSYDEYKWQYQNKIAITYEKRAEGIELPLYQCPVCGAEFKMKTQKAKLYCEQCHSEWEMDAYGKMQPLTKAIKYLDKYIDYTHIPNWYEWQRSKVQEEINQGNYHLDCKVKIESLPNAVNFIDCGYGRLVHKKEGFYLTFKDYKETEEKTLFFASHTLFSIHTEYDYRGKGQCITLSTLDNTYFLFPQEEGFNATKVQFATEYYYKLR